MRSAAHSTAVTRVPRLAWFEVMDAFQGRAPRAGPIQSSDMRGSLRPGAIRRTPRAVDAAPDEDLDGGVEDAGFGVGCRFAQSRSTTWSAQQCPCPIRILDFLSVSEISRHVFPPPYGQRPMTHGISEAANSAVASCPLVRPSRAAEQSRAGSSACSSGKAGEECRHHAQVRAARHGVEEPRVRGQRSERFPVRERLDRRLSASHITFMALSRKKATTIALDPEDDRLLSRAARERGVSRSEFIRQHLALVLEQYPAPSQAAKRRRRPDAGRAGRRARVVRCRPVAQRH